MKRILVLLAMSLAVASGCARNHGGIQKVGTSSRTDVFQELTKGGVAPAGYADLRIYATLKTHEPGAHAARDSHGTPQYQLLLNIDGQALLLKGTLQGEDSEAMKLADPESGQGVRYVFRQTLRLKEGRHRVVAALPQDAVAVEKEITLAPGKVNTLVLEPIYSAPAGMKREAPYTATHFKEGIRSISVTFNGQPDL